MQQAAMTVRMDKQLKYQFEELCNQFGMSINTAINIFVHAVIDSRSIPFTIEDQKARASREALEAFRANRQYRMDNNLPEMSLDEINAEIDAYRAERDAKRQKQAV